MHDVTEDPSSYGGNNDNIRVLYLEPTSKRRRRSKPSTGRKRGRPPLPIWKRKRLTLAEINEPLKPRGLYRPDDAEYHKQLNTLLGQCIREIEQGVYAAFPALSPMAVGHGINMLFRRAHQFHYVPMDEEALTAWAIQYVILWARRYQRWWDCWTDPAFAKSIRAGAYSALVEYEDRFGHLTIDNIVTELAEGSELTEWLFSNMNERPPSKRRRAASAKGRRPVRPRISPATLFSRVRAAAWWKGWAKAQELLRYYNVHEEIAEARNALDNEQQFRLAGKFRPNYNPLRHPSSEEEELEAEAERQPPIISGMEGCGSEFPAVL